MLRTQLGIFNSPNYYHQVILIPNPQNAADSKVCFVFLLFNKRLNLTVCFHKLVIPNFF